MNYINLAGHTENMTSILLGGFPDGLAGKESACNARDPSSIPGSGRFTEEELGYPLQYSWASLVAQLIRNLPAFDPWVGKIPWRKERLPTLVFWPGDLFHGLYIPRVAKSRTQLRDFHFHFARWTRSFSKETLRNKANPHTIIYEYFCTNSQVYRKKMLFSH